MTKRITITLTEDQAKSLVVQLKTAIRHAYYPGPKAFMERIIAKINAELVK